MSGVVVCVYCRLRPVQASCRPFCSERCKMADLGRWLKGDYRVPGAAADPAGSPESPEPDDEAPGTSDPLD